MPVRVKLTTPALLSAGLLGMVLAGLGVFGSPWPWLVVLAVGVLRPATLRYCRNVRLADEDRLTDLRAARRALDEVDRKVEARTLVLEQRVAGLFTPEQAEQLARDQTAMVARMGEIENTLAELSTILDAKRLTGMLAGPEGNG